jgi:hypothetical protein
MPREGETIETALATVRDFAGFMDRYLGKRDWALADVNDIEAFLATLPKGRKRRLTMLCQFFGCPRPGARSIQDPRPALRRPSRCPDSGGR